VLIRLDKQGSTAAMPALENHAGASTVILVCHNIGSCSISIHTLPLLHLLYKATSHACFQEMTQGLLTAQPPQLLPKQPQRLLQQAPSNRALKQPTPSSFRHSCLS
jgi:hypothetical protein